MASPCKPVRTWHGRRKQIALITTITIVAVMVAFLGSTTRAKVFKPGDLSTPHAQILSSSMDSGRCAACHPQAGASVGNWFASLTGSAVDQAHTGVSQSDRCLDCHHVTIDRSTAKFAHNLPPQTRTDLRLASLDSRESSWQDWMPSAAVNQEDVHCSACHREHRGADGKLTAMTNDQCQTCHSDRFGDFAAAHPKWDAWPYGRGGAIAFDHASHATKHFPSTLHDGEPSTFQCIDCHTRDSHGELTRSTSYEKACQACHDHALGIEASAGFDLLTLPSVTRKTAELIGIWPRQAVGFFDGRLSAIAELLMRSDPDLNDAIRKLPQRDFGRLDDQRDEDVRAARAIAEGLRDVIEQISRDGQSVMIDRITKSGIESSVIHTMFQSLSPQLIDGARRRWLTESSETEPPAQSVPAKDNAPPPRSWTSTDDDALPGDALPGDALLSDALLGDALVEDDLLGDSLLDGNLLGDNPLGDRDPLLSDPLLSDPLSSDPLVESTTIGANSAPTRFEAGLMLPAGGWYVDDLTCSIRYRGRGHSDPVIRAAAELAGQLAPGDPARERLLENKSVAACVQCHPGVLDASTRNRTSGSIDSDGGDAGWISEPLVGNSSLDRNGGFTKFSHGPHLNIAGLLDCQHCHQINRTPHDAVSSIQITTISASGRTPMSGEFLPLGIETCAGCHHREAAGDACIKCHRYHINVDLGSMMPGRAGR